MGGVTISTSLNRRERSEGERRGRYKEGEERKWEEPGVET